MGKRILKKPMILCARGTSRSRERSTKRDRARYVIEQRERLKGLFILLADYQLNVADTFI